MPAKKRIQMRISRKRPDKLIKPISTNSDILITPHLTEMNGCSRLPMTKIFQQMMDSVAEFNHEHCNYHPDDPDYVPGLILDEDMKSIQLGELKGENPGIVRVNVILWNGKRYASLQTDEYLFSEDWINVNSPEEIIEMIIKFDREMERADRMH